MSKTKIQWTEYNWNPFTGCTPVSPGCANCYARKNARRLAGNPKTDRYSKGFEFSVHPECLDQALRWKKPRKVFVNTMSDTFHENAALEVIQQVFDYMVKCSQHIFQVLTKRAERMAELSAKLPWPDNVWAGVTVENADYVNRLDFLRQVPAKVRFASFEPLLRAIPNINFEGIHWAIVGGESGPKARPMDLDWAREIRDQCLRAKIPFFFKQVGGKGRDKGGRLLDGQEFNEFPIEAVMARINYENPESETGGSSDRGTADDQAEQHEERNPVIEYFDKENPHPELKKIRIKKGNEMPKQPTSGARKEEDTVKKNSEGTQQETTEKKEPTTPMKSSPAKVGEAANSQNVATSVDAKLVAEAVQFINEKCNETVYKGAMEIGAYVLKRFFNDDIVLASSRNPRKATSYRALCQAEGLIPRPETLSIMVRVAAQEKFFLSKKLDTDSLSYTHKAELVKLPNGDEKVKLVKSVIKKALSSRQLEDRIEEIKRQRGEEPKPILHFFVREMDNPKKLFGHTELLTVLQDKESLKQELKTLKAKKLKALAAEAAKRVEETKQWVRLYQELADAIEEISGQE